MQITTVQTTGPGPSAPIRMIGPRAITERGIPNGALAYQLQPMIFVTVDSGTMRYVLEIPADGPDANGIWPSPGRWMRYEADPGIAWGQLSSSRSVAFAVKEMFSAVRVNVDAGGSLPPNTAASSGTVTLQVVQ